MRKRQKLEPYEVAFINGLYESRAILPTYELSVLCRVLQQMDDDRWMHVAELFEQYIDRNPDQWTAHINLGPNGGETFLRGMTVTNAAFLRTMTATRVHHDLAQHVVNYLLLTQERDNSFGGTCETTAVIRALCPLMRDGTFSNAGKVDWEVDGRVWTPQIRLAPGSHTLRATNRGAGTAFASARLAWLEKDVQRQPVPSSQLSVSRTYTNLTNEEQTIRVGDTLRVTVTLTALNHQSYVLISDPLPAGCVQIDAERYGFFDNHEKHERRTDFFIEELSAGKHTFSYDVRATYAGRFTALPTIAEPMYSTQFRAVGTAEEITILPREGQ